MQISSLAAQLLLHGSIAFAHLAKRVPCKSELKASLEPLLSDGAKLSFPSSDGWDDLVERASTPRISPKYLAVVEVATEDDVSHTIKIANEFGLPFLAVSGTHGWTSTLNDVHSGIQINMRRMNETTLHDDGKIATAGGGIMQYEITAALAAQKKMAVTGLCECVSTIGPALGGGHSMLQGSHGFAADNLVSARLVLANGTIITVSDEDNSDLWWAVRGAGHNFGVVASFEAKVYDTDEAGWTMKTFSFTQDSLEGFFETWNELEDDIEDPGMLVLNGVMARDNTVDPNPLINLQLLYSGTDTAVEEYISRFSTLNPIAESNTPGIPYADLYDIGGFGLESPVCRKNQNIYGLPNSFPHWDPQAMRKGYEIFSEATADERFSTSAWLLESYGRKGVQSVPAETNAVAPEEREYHILTSPILWWVGDDAGDAKDAKEFGERMRAAVRPSGKSAHTYLNYAGGSEELGEVYGRDQQRIQKLKDLKNKWDPENRFGFYNPIN